VVKVGVGQGLGVPRGRVAEVGDLAITTVVVPTHVSNFHLPTLDGFDKRWQPYAAATAAACAEEVLLVIAPAEVAKTQTVDQAMQEASG
jgi:hypothetical protein